MKRLFVAVAVVLSGSSIVAAQESADTELEFVRKLRSKGYHEIAKEYIDGLLKRQPGLAGQLALEQARSLVAMARDKDINQRTALFNQAKDLFEGFVKKYAGKPEATEARLELAKLVAYHAQALLAKALREEKTKDQHEAARPAEAMFIEAGKALDAVIKQLSDKPQVLAKFERAVNYIDQARTYIDLSKDVSNTRRAQLINEAKKAFEAIAADEKAEVGLLASAWLVKCLQEMQDPTAAKKYYTRVMAADARDGDIAPAQRLARYFYIQSIPKDVTIKAKPIEKIKLIQKEGVAWLRDYPTAHKTWEGQGVRMELANAYLAEAQASFKDLKSAGAVTLLNQAYKHFAALEDLDGEWSEEAKRNAIFIKVNQLQKVDLKDIRDFENAYLKGQYELYKLDHAFQTEAKDEKERKKIEADKKHHLREAIRAVQYAIGLADLKTPLSKVGEARFLLIKIYFNSGDIFRAAVAGEALARAKPPTKRSPQAAGVALLALDAITTRDPSAANQQRIRDLAEFIIAPETQKFWSGEPVSAVAMYQLAMLDNKDNNYKSALDRLEKLPKDFAGYTYAQGQCAFIALGAAAEKAQSDEERKTLRQRARAAIERMPDSLPADTDASTAAMYYHAQMELPKFWYADAALLLDKGDLAKASEKYRQMAKFVDAHYQDYSKSGLKFEAETKEKLDTLMTVLQKYSRLGLADVEYRLGNYDKVIADDFTGKTVTQLKALAKKAGPIKLKDHQVTGETVGLALRANIQKGDFDAAKALFEILDRIASDDDNPLAVDNTNMMRSLVVDMKLQVKDLEKQKDPEKLKETTEKFGKFIDAIGDVILKKRSDPKDFVFLGDAYSSLKQPSKAAELFAKVAKPKALDKEQLDDKDLEEVQTYWFLKIQHAKALRESGEFKTANGMLNELLLHKHGQYHILAEFEKNFILHDAKLWGPAIKNWQAMMPRLGKRAAEDNQVKKLYFDAYYWNTYCIYMYSQSERVKGTPKEEQYIRFAATGIVRLENAQNSEGWDLVGEKFRELMNSESKLKEEYEKQKKAMGQ